MIVDINRWLLQRLAVVCIVLSLVSGGLVQYLGHARLTEHIVQMAKTETLVYTTEFREYLNSPSERAHSLIRDRLYTTIGKDNFAEVRLYDANQNMIVEVTILSSIIMEDKFPRHHTEFPPDDGTINENIALDGKTYLHIHFPIKDRKGVKFGYLDGIYQAPSEIVAQMKHQIFWSLLLVILAIFVTGLTLYPLIIRLNNKLKKHAHTLALANIGMLKVLGSAIAKRDSDTNTHNYRVTLYSIRLGEALGLSKAKMQGLIKGAFLHDVGKIAITDTILQKPGKLTAEEFEVMKTHVNHGVDIIGDFIWLKDALDVVQCHHEKFDGSGYPCQMRGEDIPKNARIFAIVDVFDAITSRRPYKDPFSFKASIEIIQESQGSHLDPPLTRLFLENAKDFYEEICNEDEISLQASLDECISNYFD